MAFTSFVLAALLLAGQYASALQVPGSKCLGFETSNGSPDSSSYSLTKSISGCGCKGNDCQVEYCPDTVIGCDPPPGTSWLEYDVEGVRTAAFIHLPGFVHAAKSQIAKSFAPNFQIANKPCTGSRTPLQSPRTPNVCNANSIQAKRCFTRLARHDH